MRPLHPRGPGSATGGSNDPTRNSATDNNIAGQDLSRAFGCIADVGESGCGFESPLAAARRALQRASDPTDPESSGFLRPDAWLALIFLTDEDDCSLPADSLLGDFASTELSSPLGPLTSFRCMERGVLILVPARIRTPIEHDYDYDFPTDLEPTMRAVTLPEHAAPRFRQVGGVHVPRFCAPAETAALLGWVEDLDRAPAVRGGGMKYVADQRIEYFRRFHAPLRAFVEGPLLAAVEALLGEPAMLFKDKVNLKQGGGSGFTPHQDAQAGWEDYAPLHVTAAIALDAATIENGCLELAQGPRLGALVGERWRPLDGPALDALHFAPVEMAAGDALFFDSFLPHQSGPNRTTEPRRLLYVTYNARAHGDHYEAYFAAKRASYPPDAEREPGRDYRFKV